jgi:copper transport protein
LPGAGAVSRGVRRLLILLGVAVAVLVPAAPAQAHAILLHTSPGSGAIIQDPPSGVTLRFNEPVELVTGAIKVIGPDGSTVSTAVGRTGDGSIVRIRLRGELPRGTFLVTYRVISADSHPVAGGYSFSLGAPSRTAPAATGGTGASENPVVAVAMPVARYLGFAGLVLVVGPVLVLMSLWPARLSRRGPARLIRTGLGLLAFATLAEFYLQMPYSSGSSIFSVTYPDVVDALNSRFGWAHVLRLVLLGAAVPLVAIVTGETRNRLSTGERVVLGLLAVVGVGTWGYGGHPSTSPVPWITVLSDMVHVAAMSVWLGGLLMLLVFLLPRGRPKELAALLPVWSRWATIAVSVLAAAGIVQACLQLGTPSALVGTTYGKLIIVKVVAFAVILAVAGYSRAAVRRGSLAPAAPVPVPAGDSDYGDPVWDEVYGDSAPPEPPKPATPAGGLPRRELRRLVAVEAGIAAAILGVTAILVQTTPARSATTVASEQQNLPYNKTLDDRLFSLQVQVDPARTGQNTVHAIAYHPSDGRPVKVLQWQATATLPSAGITLDLKLKAITDNHAIADVTLPRAGTWRFAFTLRVSAIDEDTVTAVVPVH